MGFLNGLGAPELLIIAVIIGCVFGFGKLTSTLGDLGKGVREFKKGLSEADEAAKTLNG